MDDRHIHLFQCPTRFDNLCAPDAFEKESYYVRNLTAISEMAPREQDTYIEDIFKERRRNIFSVFSIEHFDLLYSFCKALPSGEVTKSARGLLAQCLSSTLIVISKLIVDECAEHASDEALADDDRNKKSNTKRGSGTSFAYKASLLRGITNMCIFLLWKTVTSPVSHLEDDGAAGAGGDDRHPLSTQQQNTQQRGLGKKKRVRKGLEDGDELEDGIFMETLENMLRGFVEIMSVEGSAVWSELPTPVRDFDTGEIKNETEINQPKNADAMPDHQMVLLALQTTVHLAGQKRTFITEASNPLGRGIVDVLRVLGRCVAMRHERELVVVVAAEEAAAAAASAAGGGGGSPRGVLPDAAIGFDVRVNRGAADRAATPPPGEQQQQQQQQQAADGGDDKNAPPTSAGNIVTAASPRDVVVHPLVDVLLRVTPGPVAELVGKLIVSLLLEYDSSARTDDADAERIATVLYLSDEAINRAAATGAGAGGGKTAGAGHGISAKTADGNISEPLLMAKLVSMFLEAIVYAGVNAEPSTREAKNVAQFVDTLARTAGSLTIVAKHAPILMPMLQSECTDSRKAAVTLISELVAERYASPSHHSWAVAIEQIAIRTEQQQQVAAAAGVDSAIANPDGGEQQQEDNSKNKEDEEEEDPDDRPLVQQQQQPASGVRNLHDLSPELVALRDNYLKDLLQRVMDLNNFVRLHTIKQWESLVRRRAVPRCFHLSVFDISVSRLLDRSHLVRCAALSLLRAALQANWFSEQLSHTNVNGRHMYEYQALMRRVEIEVNNEYAGSVIKPEEAQVALKAEERLNNMMNGMRHYMLATGNGNQPQQQQQQQQQARQQNINNSNNNNVDSPDDRGRQQQKQSNAYYGQKRDMTQYDVYLARLVFLESAVRAAEAAELGLRLAVDMLASKTNKDMTDAMQFIVAACASRMDSASSAFEKVLLLVFHHDPSIVNAVCDSFINVFYTAFEATQAPVLAKNVARVQKITSMLVESSEGTFAAVEKIIDTLASRQSTAVSAAGLAAASSSNAAAALVRAVGRPPGSGGGVRAGGAMANGGQFFTRDFFDACWGVADGSLYRDISSRQRCAALRLFGCLAKNENREITIRRTEIIRLIQAFHNDNLMMGAAFHVLAKEVLPDNMIVNNVAPDFDPVDVALDTDAGADNNNNNNNNRTMAMNQRQVNNQAVRRGVKLATLHLCRATTNCPGWMALAEAAVTYLQRAVLHPAFLYAMIIDSVEDSVKVLEESLAALTATSNDDNDNNNKKGQQQRNSNDGNNNNNSSSSAREAVQIRLLNRKAQFFFLIGHTCIKHLVNIEEYEKRELAAVSERVPRGSAGGGDDPFAPAGRPSGGGAVPRDSTMSRMSQKSMGRGQKVDDDAMSKELGLSSADFQRNQVRDGCDYAREATCLADTDPKYKQVMQRVPQHLQVPPIWGKLTPAVERACKTKFVMTSGLSASVFDGSSFSSSAAGAGAGAAVAAAAADGAAGSNNVNSSHLPCSTADEVKQRMTDMFCSPGLYSAMVSHRSASTLALIKLMIASANFCRAQLPLLFTLLQQQDEPWEVKTGIVMGLGDLAVIHPNLLQPYMKIASSGFYALLADPDIRVRSVAIQVCTHLVLNDMLLVGDHVHTIVRLAADSDPTIRHSAETFAQYLAVKRQKELHNIIPPLVKALSTSGELGTIGANAADAAEPVDADAADGRGSSSSSTSPASPSSSASKKQAPLRNKAAAAAAAATTVKKEEQRDQKSSSGSNAFQPRRVPAMAEPEFQQAITTLLENVEKGAATDSLIQKLCMGFTRFDDHNSETVQLNRNLAYCLSEMPFQTEREVKRITSDVLFEKYKDWMRDPQVNAMFEKIVVKAKRNITLGKGIAEADAHHTDRRDKALLEEWIVKLQDAAAHGNKSKRVKKEEAAAAAAAAAAGGGDDDEDAQVDEDGAPPRTPAGFGSVGRQQRGGGGNSGGKSSNRKNKPVGRQLVDSSTSGDDDDDSSSDDEYRKRSNKKAVRGKKSAAGVGGKKGAAAAKKKKKFESSSSDEDESSTSSSSDDSSSDDDDDSSSSEDVPKRRAPAPKRGGKR